jgi:RNA polymerase-binding protein DksA
MARATTRKATQTTKSAKASEAASTSRSSTSRTSKKTAAGSARSAAKKSGSTRPGTAVKKSAAPSKKASTRKPTATSKRATVTKAEQKAPEKRASAKKTAKKAGAKAATSAKTTTKTATARTRTSAAAKKLAVKSDEKPWTVKELAEVRGELTSERERLRAELNMAEVELHDLMRDAGDGAGNDQADVGSASFERDHEMSLANNARLMLAQTEHALARIDDGSYGICERCGQPVGKMRLMAFPRATLCLSCKQREERR